jgi:autotransporter passenger strand-loop-strand repeat protein
VACYALEMTLYLAHIDGGGAKHHYPAPPELFVLGSIRRLAQAPSKVQVHLRHVTAFSQRRWAHRLRVRLAIQSTTISSSGGEDVFSGGAASNTILRPCPSVACRGSGFARARWLRNFALPSDDHGGLFMIDPPANQQLLSHPQHLIRRCAER